ncbi:10337_t:CDS:2, partial [Paraglomus brasilianum]
ISSTPLSPPPTTSFSPLCNLFFPVLRRDKPSFAQLCQILNKLEQCFLETQRTVLWDTGLAIEETEKESAAVNRKEGVEWLTKVVASSLEWIEDNEREEVLERAAKCLAACCGKVATGAIIREWHFATPLDSTPSITLRIRDSTFVDDNVGFKTWGSAYLLAKLISSGSSIPLTSLRSRSAMELGTGTGLVGLACATLGCPRVVLTDYHPQVLSNAAYNIQLVQSLQSEILLHRLDWQEIAEGADKAIDETFDIIIGADIVYEIVHTQWLPRVIDRYLKRDGVFYLLIPLRPTHSKEVELFEESMSENGFVTVRCDEERGFDDFVGELKYRYYEWIRK